jgi:tripartite-type tricarboxylate transporter receptor subunit TctC
MNLQKRWIAAAALMLGAAAGARAADYPDHAIRMVVGFPAGGASDVAARAVAAKMGQILGQAIIVDNRPGAASNIGSNIVAKAKPDGYTLMFGTISFAINGSLYKDLSFDAIRDFAPISELASSPFILLVNPKFNVRTVRQLIDAARAAPADKPIQFASAGNGSGAHLFTELFTSMAGIHLAHVPYRGAAPAMADVLGNQVPMTFDNIITSLPLVKSGQLVALGVSSAQRSKVAPDIPTLNESGVPGFDATAWFGLFAPAGTSEAIVQKLNKAATQAVQDPAVSKTLLGLGAEPTSSSPQAFATFFRNEVNKWSKVVRDAHVQIN